ncbi:quinolinate synthase NadA [Pseudobutyrivibrio xylanivorans]|uniref:Quinolinate synthase n=1 Tax=Pseudobutyrivibrio xylanivorans TaxID=185007 RepID=A0A5P6VV99_PSEXY|nr:quinolinate synthase NadA [Pseudobutyrivibrio xylanivorans]QFJ54851.1 quinolinate synthase NadA [Pseudobutyrivibrio xylanivorans]
METLVEEIQRLKKEKNAVILAHYYVNDEVQEIADYIGDSYYLAKVAVGLKESTIVFAGVKFMGESAKILNPEKTVLMPDAKADCPMAHMAEIERIEEVRKEYEDLAVVCYINSTAELKMHSDVCVTSSNAMKIVKALPNKNIFFIPDENLGRYIASKVPEKNFIFNDGYCHVHKAVTPDMIKCAKESHPDAKVLIHPECTLDVLELADYIGSTSGIIDYATESDAKEFIISTELGVLYQLKKNNPDKQFFAAGSVQICPNMKKVTLEKVRDCLRDGSGVVELDDEKRERALAPLQRMLELAK